MSDWLQGPYVPLCFYFIIFFTRYMCCTRRMATTWARLLFSLSLAFSLRPSLALLLVVLLINCMLYYSPVSSLFSSFYSSFTILCIIHSLVIASFTPSQSSFTTFSCIHSLVIKYYPYPNHLLPPSHSSLLLILHLFPGPTL